jgi:hypothetical protein
MTRLIGSRWKRREAWSRGVLIRPVSRAEFCKAQSFVCIPFTYSGQTERFRAFGSGALSEGCNASARSIAEPQRDGARRGRARFSAENDA